MMGYLFLSQLSPDYFSYLFPRIAITNYHNWWLKTTELHYLTVLEARGTKPRRIGSFWNL